MASQVDCLFCRIIDKKIPASVVHETDATLAFRDVNPQAPVHILVIPKEHVAGLIDLPAAQATLFGQINETILAVVRSENIATSGFRVVVNNGTDACQTVAHLHFHVLGGRRLGWPPG